MELPVLIEPTPDGRYRARSGEPLVLTAEGATMHDALQGLRKRINERLEAGASLVSMTIPVMDSENPWIRGAGMFKDNPLFEEWVEAMQENRRARDLEDGIS